MYSDNASSELNRGGSDFPESVVMSAINYLDREKCSEEYGALYYHQFSCRQFSCTLCFCHNQKQVGYGGCFVYLLRTPHFVTTTSWRRRLLRSLVRWQVADPRRMALHNRRQDLLESASEVTLKNSLLTKHSKLPLKMFQWT
uniref:Uncharacterized protein n=1 Tax=Trichobilharzia regenti TaxID=157069 RepID=A0AA85IX71_TRIRE|nr:unnamed protein product [Trichobilharzia regenti]